jgi:hypothetical protein
VEKCPGSTRRSGPIQPCPASADPAQAATRSCASTIRTEMKYGRGFGTADGTWSAAVALNAGGVYVAGRTSSDAFRDWWELAPKAVYEALQPVSAFLAKFEKAAEVASRSVPHIFPDCVLNAASYVGVGGAPGEMVTILGSAVGPSEPVRVSTTGEGWLAPRWPAHASCSMAFRLRCFMYRITRRALMSLTQ